MDDYELHCLGELFVLHEIEKRHGYTFLQFVRAYEMGRHVELLKGGVLWPGSHLSSPSY